MNLDPWRILARLILAASTAIVAGAIIFLCSCSELIRTETAARTDTRTREVTVVHGQVPVTLADGSIQIVATTTTTERTLSAEEVSKSDSSGERHSAPDVPAIVAAAQPIISAAPGIGIGQIVAAGTALAGTTLAGWMARRGEVSDKDKRLERLRQERDSHQQRAERYALKLPPDTLEDHA